jgi:cbb3-type cytochrome oxidase maturation protein
VSLLLTWTLYALIATGFLVALFAWAVRTGQFADQDRARYLALSASGGGPEGRDEHEAHPEPWQQR